MFIMSMRYLSRRKNGGDFSDVRSLVPGLEEKLGPAGQNLRRQVPVVVSRIQTTVFQFEAVKDGTTWKWVCPSVEYVAESEVALRDLLQKNGIGHEKLPHLAT